VRTVNDDLFIGEQFARDPVQGVFPVAPENPEHELLPQEL
jgi:hypothetical protein